MWLKCILAANLLVNWLLAQKLCRLCSESDYNTTLQLNISLCSFHCFLVCIWLIVEYSLCLFQLYRLEKYSECYAIYKDLLKNTQVCNVYSCVNAFVSSAGSCVDLWMCLTLSSESVCDVTCCRRMIMKRNVRLICRQRWQPCSCGETKRWYVHNVL